MIGIRPSSRVGQAALWLQLAAGCSFDSTPANPARVDAGATAAAWQPPTLERRSIAIDQQAPSSNRIMTAHDAGVRKPAADGGRENLDAGQPLVQRDAAPSNSSMPDATPAMGMPTVTQPAMPSQCMPGIYEGAFEGPVTFAVGSINSVSGTVRAELVLEASGDHLTVRNGMMTGKDNAGVGMMSAWTGSVNCATKQLENGRHDKGAWDNGSTFTGTMDGTYTVNPYTLAGKWQVQSEQIPLAGGNGTWHMSLVN